MAAVAPAFTAASRKSWPSRSVPLTAMNTAPDATCRLSSVIAVAETGKVPSRSVMSCADASAVVTSARENAVTC